MSPKNDQKLWSLEGIAEALDEVDGELGIAVKYGWVCLGVAYPPANRALCPASDMPDVRTAPRPVELWATITVDEKEVRDFLRADAEQHLQPGTRFEIRKQYPNNFGRTHGMAWYRNAAMDKREDWGRVPMQPEAAAGYFLVGEFTTPPAS